MLDHFPVTAVEGDAKAVTLVERRSRERLDNFFTVALLQGCHLDENRNTSRDLDEIVDAFLFQADAEEAGDLRFSQPIRREVTAEERGSNKDVVSRLAVATTSGGIQSETTNRENLLRLFHLVTAEHQTITDTLQLDGLVLGVDGETAILARVDVDEELSGGALGVEELGHCWELDTMPLPIAEDTNTGVEKRRVVLEEVVFFLVFDGGNWDDAGGTVGDFGGGGTDAGHGVELTESLRECNPVLETIELLSIWG